MSTKVQQLATHLRSYYNKYLTVLIVLLVCLGLGYAIFIQPTITESDLAPTTAVVSNNVLASSSPRSLRIPKISLTADFEAPLGVMSDGEVAVPTEYEKVGWYKYSPTPGELGPAVILGHVDSFKGPAVFYNLRQLVAGDEIYVDREDGTTATFIITKISQHPQTGFPTEEVYGNIDHAGLRLITCAGTYDKGTARYSHNLIVYGELKE